MAEKKREGMERRDFLRLLGIGAGGLLGISRLAKAIASPPSPLKVICYNSTDPFPCPLDFDCPTTFYCQDFTCDALPSNESADFDCHKVFSCPGSGSKEHFRCLNKDFLTANFNCADRNKDNNFTCNPGSRFSRCDDFYCENKFACVDGYARCTTPPTFVCQQQGGYSSSFP